MESIDNRVRKVLKKHKNGITAEKLAVELDRDSKNMAKSGRSAVYEAKQADPKLETKIKKRWDPTNECYRYYLQEVDVKALYNSVSKTSEILKGDMPIRDGSIDVLLEVDEPILVVIISDLHLGHMYTDYQAIKQVFDDIKPYENIYIVGLGDLIDNSLNTHAPQGAENLIDKNDQLDLIEYLFEKVKDRIIVLYEGNHELRSWISDHFLPNSWLALRHKTNYGFYAEPFIVDVNGEKYQFFCRHKPTGKSQYHPLHAGIKSCIFSGAELARNADIIITAHTHTPGIGNFSVGGKMRYIVSTGAMVEFDDYAERVGYVSGVHKSTPAIYLDGENPPELFIDYKVALNRAKNSPITLNKIKN